MCASTMHNEKKVIHKDIKHVFMLRPCGLNYGHSPCMSEANLNPQICCRKVHLQHLDVEIESKFIQRVNTVFTCVIKSFIFSPPIFATLKILNRRQWSCIKYPIRVSFTKAKSTLM